MLKNWNKVLLGTVTIGSVIAGCCNSESEKRNQEAKKLFCECFGCSENDVLLFESFSASVDFAVENTLIKMNAKFPVLIEDLKKSGIKDQLNDLQKERGKNPIPVFMIDLPKKMHFLAAVSNYKPNNEKVEKVISVHKEEDILNAANNVLWSSNDVLFVIQGLGGDEVFVIFKLKSTPAKPEPGK